MKNPILASVALGTMLLAEGAVQQIVAAVTPEPSQPAVTKVGYRHRTWDRRYHRGWVGPRYGNRYWDGRRWRWR